MIKSPDTGFIDNYVVPCLRKILMPRYNSQGQQPCDFTNQSPNVRTQTPILIASVKGDNKVPQRHQIALYKKLKDTGHNVYFYEIKRGNHDTLASEHSEEHAKLVQVVQGFQNYVNSKKHDRLPVALASEERWYSSPSSAVISEYFAAREQLEKSMEPLKKYMLGLS